MKKAIIVVLILALVAGISIGGTMAWLQDDDSSKNTMVVGNVNIEQHEYERVKNEDGSYKTATIDNQTSYVLKEFHQINTGHPIYPATELDANGNPFNYGAGTYDTTYVRMTQVDSYGGAQMFETPLAIDNVVTVENTGETDAYIRTLVAIEAGSVSAEDHLNLIKRGGFKTNPGEVWTLEMIGIVNIDGNNYYVTEYVYNGAKHMGGMHDGYLPAGETSYPSLLQIYMTAAATNEDCEALDGNNNGVLDVLVISQAVQTAGFADAATALDTAFGDVTADTAPAMFEEADSKIVTGEDLKDAIENGDGNITLDGDIDLGGLGGLIFGNG